MKMETISACSIWRALEVVGDAPVLLLLEQAFLGKHRFDEFAEGTGLARAVVSNRLGRLVEAEILRKATERQGGYRLTEKGMQLYPVALMILRWQYRWPENPTSGSQALALAHAACGQATIPVPRCSHCHAEIDPREVDWKPGPGLTQVVPVYARRRKQSSAGRGNRPDRAMLDLAVELFGDRWATLVIRACFAGLRRFDAIQRDALIATNILADRLAFLQANGLLVARRYSAHQDRHEYRLTEKGRDLYPVLLALLEWGDTWYCDAKGPPLLLTHRPCGASLAMRVDCGGCDAPLNSHNTGFIATAPLAESA